MSKSSYIYWQERAAELERKVYKDAEKLNKELAKHYLAAINEILDQVRAFFQKYADDQGMTYQEAQKQLNRAELKEYQEKIKWMMEAWRKFPSKRLDDEFKLFNTKMKVTRLEALLNQIIVRLDTLAADFEQRLTEHLKQVYEAGYYMTSYNIQSALGINSFIPKLNEAAVVAAINYPWSGYVFSENIWRNRDKLIDELKRVLIQGIIQGKSIQKMTRELKKKMDTSRYNSERIIRTESNFVLNEATAQGYQANDVKKYEILATLDSRTSDTCRRQDGKVYETAKKIQGVNYPPFHPHCRTTVIPWFDDIDKEKEKRRARDTGVIENISYDEWFKKYVK